MNRKRYAVLSMDIEDWYHLGILEGHSCDQSYSVLDGLDRYMELMDDQGVPSSFFCLGELAEPLKNRLRDIQARGWEVGSHTFSHRRMLLLSLVEVEEELRRTKDVLEQIIGGPVNGFRAPSFSFDRERLEILPRLGYLYDASRMRFDMNPLYGKMDMTGFRPLSPNIFERDGFFEFQMSTQRFLHRDFPVSGGGYLRMLPWTFTKTLLKRFLANNELYTLYIHPYELSDRPAPPFPPGVGFAKKTRYGLGKKTVVPKIIKLIALLRAAGFEFTTFSALRKWLLETQRLETGSAFPNAARENLY